VKYGERESRHTAGTRFFNDFPLSDGFQILSHITKSWNAGKTNIILSVLNIPVLPAQKLVEYSKQKSLKNWPSGC
jgi:hypothetical protein